MTRKRAGLLIAAVFAVTALVFFFLRPRSETLVLTGIVTTDSVSVGPEVAGRITRLLVREGDLVKSGQLLAVIEPAELRADRAFYAHSAEAATAQVKESQAALEYQEHQTTDQIQQANANLAASIAQRAQAAADLENARLIYERNRDLSKQGVAAQQDLDQSRTAFDAAQARLEAATKQVDAQRAALALATSGASQVAQRRSQVANSEQQRAAAYDQRAKADVRLGYTEVHAPMEGIVDVRAALLGEVVNAGQPIVTLINPDDLWARIDVEESYIDQIRLSDRLAVRLPSGVEHSGTVFFRGLDASFATQRDVSRTKRDVKTFEVRLRVDNSDRSLAVGMTVYVPIRVKR
jgi:HlyD family secretion protein